ncbi:MAG: hypothetical protein DRG25_05970, partial [Deltaproteobacteria bacterium]
MKLKKKFGPYRVILKPAFLNIYRNEKRVNAFIDDCIKMLQYKFKVARYLLNKCNFDVTFLHEWGTDTVQHQLWDILHPNDQHCNPKEKQKYFLKAISYYQALDQEIADILSEIGEDVSLLIVSDHGFGPLSKMINLNVWLIREGYLKFKKNFFSQLKFFLWKRGVNYNNLIHTFLVNVVLKFFLKIGLNPPKPPDADKMLRLLTSKKRFFLSLADVDWSKTRAYTKTGVGQIVINQKGREPQGIVNPGTEFSELQKELIEKLRCLKDPETGEVIKSD